MSSSVPCTPVRRSKVPVEEQLASLTVKQLKAELALLDLPQSGRKAELVERLVRPHMALRACPFVF